MYAISRVNPKRWGTDLMIKVVSGRCYILDNDAIEQMLERLKSMKEGALIVIDDSNRINLLKVISNMQTYSSDPPPLWY